MNNRVQFNRRSGRQKFSNKKIGKERFDMSKNEGRVMGIIIAFACIYIIVSIIIFTGFKNKKIKK